MTDTLLKYRYEAETIEGTPVKGSIEAASVVAARNELAVRGMRATKITEKKGLQVELTQQKIPMIDIMHFSRQMGTFIRAGIPMVEALDTLRADTENKRFKAVLADIVEKVGQSGMTLGDAVATHPDVFPGYFLSMLRSAELTGKMDEAFEQLTSYIRRDVALTKQVRKALIYPAILLVVAMGVVAIITIFVIPKFAEFFKSFGAKLPLPTRMLMAVADFVGSTAGLITGLILVALIIGVVLYVRAPGGRRNLHALLLKIPVLNTVVVFSSTERFCRVLSVLMDAGVPLAEAMPSAIDCTTNTIFRERLGVATEGVLVGRGFADPVAQTEVFPPTVVQMMRVGERTGELSDQLGSIAGFFEEELDYAVEKLTQWFEPLIILIIGVVVGFVALAMVSAMYGIYGQVSV
ncbi:MAG: type II secretion system F family protein [Microthrixaceae bacterium]